MTLQSERIREAHRGWRRAEPASRSRLAALETFGLAYERIDDFNVIVEGSYQLNLAMSFWRAIDDSAQGYLVSALDAEIRRRRNIEKLAAGRDSVVVLSDATPSENVRHVESAASDTSYAALMARPAWP